jgi:hypothetical protein
MVGSEGSGVAEATPWDRFLASGSIWMETDLAPPAGRENLLGAGTFSKAFRPEECIENLKYSYRLLLSFLHSSKSFVL